MKFSTKWSPKSRLGSEGRWPRIALRRGSREKLPLLSLKFFRQSFSKRKKKGKWEHNSHPKLLYSPETTLFWSLDHGQGSACFQLGRPDLVTTDPDHGRVTCATRAHSVMTSSMMSSPTLALGPTRVPVF